MGRLRHRQGQFGLPHPPWLFWGSLCRQVSGRAREARGYKSCQEGPRSILWACPKARKLHKPRALTAAPRWKRLAQEPVLSIRYPLTYTPSTPAGRDQGSAPRPTLPRAPSRAQKPKGSQDQARRAQCPPSPGAGALRQARDPGSTDPQPLGGLPPPMPWPVSWGTQTPRAEAALGTESTSYLPGPQLCWPHLWTGQSKDSGSENIVGCRGQDGSQLEGERTSPKRKPA